MAEEGQESTRTDGQEPNAEGQEPNVEKPNEDQASKRPVDEATVKQLRREAAQSRVRAQEAETKLKELLDRDKSETERLAESKANAEVRAQKAELKLLRYEVAAAHGLELRAAEFLTGETREELEERADELVKLLAEQAKPARTSFDGGARTTPEQTKEPAVAHNELLLRQLGKRSG